MSESKQNRPSRRPKLEALRQTLHREAERSPDRTALAANTLITAAKSAAPRTPAISTLRLRAAGALAAAALIALSVAVLWKMGTLKPRPEGPRTHRLFSGLWTPSAAELAAGERDLETPASGGAKIVWPNRTALWSAGRTALTVTDAGNAIRFHRGRTLSRVTAMPSGKTFRVETPLGTVSVHGTIFSVCGDRTAITVRLYEGAVRFAHRGGEIALKPGESLALFPNRPPTVRSIDETEVLSDLLIGADTALLDGPLYPALAAPEPPEEKAIRPTPAPADDAPSPPQRRPARKSPKAKPLPDTDVDSDRAPPPFADPRLEAIEITRGDTAPPGDETAEVEALIRARRYEACIRAADRAAATNPNGPDADRLQYLSGYCRTRAGDPAAGRAAFEQYLIRFPEGRYWDRVNRILGE